MVLALALPMPRPTAAGWVAALSWIYLLLSLICTLAAIKLNLRLHRRTLRELDGSRTHFTSAARRSGLPQASSEG